MEVTDERVSTLRKHITSPGGAYGVKAKIIDGRLDSVRFYDNATASTIRSHEVTVRSREEVEAFRDLLTEALRRTTPTEGET